MSSQSASPDAFEDDPEAVNGSRFIGRNECHRQLLWQEIWEYLIHECRERAARRGQEEDQSRNLEDAMSTVATAHLGSSRANNTRQAD